MIFLFDVFPLLLFYIAFKIQGIFVATAVGMIAGIGQVSWVWLRHRKVRKILWVSLASVVVLGSATLILHNEIFIKWKPTVLFWILGSVLLVSERFFKRNLVRSLIAEEIESLGEPFNIPEDAWTRLNGMWTTFFAFMGAANLYVAYQYSTDAWTNFHTFGTAGLILVFSLIQALTMAKYMQVKEPD